MNPNSSLSADELRHVSGSLKRAHMSDHLATAVFYVVSGSFVLLLIAFTMYVVWGGIKAFRPEIFSFEANGIGNQFFNTVYLVFLSLVISVPIGIFAGVYMAEYAPEGRIIHALRIAIETLSSLPSIVVGLFGYLVFIIMVGSQWNLFAGALAVSVLSLPLITATTYDALKALPHGFKEGSLALGATHFETIWKVMLPAAHVHERLCREPGPHPCLHRRSPAYRRGNRKPHAGDGAGKGGIQEISGAESFSRGGGIFADHSQHREGGKRGRKTLTLKCLHREVILFGPVYCGYG